LRDTLAQDQSREYIRNKFGFGDIIKILSSNCNEELEIISSCMISLVKDNICLESLMKNNLLPSLMSLLYSNFSSCIVKDNILRVLGIITENEIYLSNVINIVGLSKILIDILPIHLSDEGRDHLLKLLSFIQIEYNQKEILYALIENIDKCRYRSSKLISLKLSNSLFNKLPYNQQDELRNWIHQEDHPSIFILYNLSKEEKEFSILTTPLTQKRYSITTYFTPTHPPIIPKKN